jgi:putative ABC transport system permease protein
MNRTALQNALVMAFSQIWRSRSRSALTSLGVLIGVASVIAMVGIGQGATASIASDLSSFGVNMLMVRSGAGRGPQSRSAAPPLDLADAEAVSARIPGLAGVAPTVGSQALVVANGTDLTTSITGTTSAWLGVSGRSLSEGRMFSEGEERAGAAVCVLGATVQEELFEDLDPLDARVRIGQVDCLVIGLLEAQGQDTMGNDRDDLIIMPVRTVQRRLVGNSDVSMIMVSVARAGDMDMVQADLDLLMRERRHITGDDAVNFEVRDTREMANMMSGITSTLTAFLAAVAGVSLFVGGIGIMNIMLVSVTERTGEIGIRMAIGALESDIRAQFLVEAGVLSGLGGLAGALVGTLGTWLGATLLGLPVVVSIPTILLSVGFSVLMGVAFGWVPAHRAAQLEPVEALRQH